VVAELRNQLRGRDCRPFTRDGAIETKPGQIRGPDIGVDCERRDNATKAASPRVVIEVLSPTTRDFDTIDKLEEYKMVGSLTRIVVIEPNAPEVIVWTRGEAGTGRSRGSVRPSKCRKSASRCRSRRSATAWSFRPGHGW
jgi:Uma2 family endonuclease